RARKWDLGRLLQRFSVDSFHSRLPGMGGDERHRRSQVRRELCFAEQIDAFVFRHFDELREVAGGINPDSDAAGGPDRLLDPPEPAPQVVEIPVPERRVARTENGPDAEIPDFGNAKENRVIARPSAVSRVIPLHRAFPLLAELLLDG